MSDVSSEYVPATPDSKGSPPRLVPPQNFVYKTPEKRNGSGVSVSSEERSPDISFIFRRTSSTLEARPVSPEPISISSPMPDARRSLDFKKIRVAKKPFRMDFKNALYKVLKKIDKNGAISSKGMDVMNDIMVDLFDKLALTGASLLKKDKGSTLRPRDIQTAVRFLVPGQLGTHAFYEGWKALTNTHEHDQARARGRK